MKKRISLLIAKGLPSFLLLCSHFTAKTQTVFFCFIAPANVISTKFGTPGDSTGCPIGYTLVQITDNNKAKFDGIAPPNLKYVYAQLNKGRPLRNDIDKVLKNSGGKVSQVVYYLIDDRTALSGSPGDTNHVFLTYKDASKNHVWPAAFNGESKAKPGKYTGWIMMGEHQLQFDQSQRTGRMKAVDELVLHETSHTQLIGGRSKWKTGGMAISYGKDGSHYNTEILGDQAVAMDEGLATFYGLIMNDSAYQKLLKSLTSTAQRFFVESRSVMAGQNELYKIKSRTADNPKDDEGNDQLYPDGKPIIFFYYDWRTVPGWYLLFAEGTSTAFFSLFRNFTYQNKDTAYSMIKRTTIDMSVDYKKRFLTYSCNQLALRMEEYNASKKGPTGDNRISSMFPFALLDLLTHFGMTEEMYKADLRRANPEKYSKAAVAYWEIRNTVRKLVEGDMNASPVRFREALKVLEDFFRIQETILAP